MKKRLGFVANSSSSDYLIDDEDENYFWKNGQRAEPDEDGFGLILQDGTHFFPVDLQQQIEYARPKSNVQILNVFTPEDVIELRCKQLLSSLEENRKGETK